MKKQLSILLGLLLFIPFNSCDVDEQLHQDAPESVVLFARQTLEQEVYKAPNMVDYIYNLYLYRSGVKNTNQVQVAITVDAAALDAYNAENSTQFTLLPEAYYSFEASVDIPAGQQKAISQVTIKADKISSEIGFNDDFAIPFRIQPTAGITTNEENNLVILKVNILEPVIRQGTYGLEEGSAEGKGTYTKAVNVFVEFENEWDIQLGYEVDLSLVASYNAANNTDYRVFPEANIVSLPAAFTLPAGSNSTSVELKLAAEGLQYFDPYLLPIRLVSMGEFPVDLTREIIYVKFSRTFDSNMAEFIPLTNEMIDTWTQEVHEGPKENLVDGNTATYWHSSWSSNVNPLPHWIQINFDQVTQLGGITYTFRQPSGSGGRPNQFDIQVSDDGEAWTTVWTSRANLPVTPVDAVQTLVFDKNYASRYFRVRILANPGNVTYTHLSTLKVFRVKD